MAFIEQIAVIKLLAIYISVILPLLHVLRTCFLLLISECTLLAQLNSQGLSRHALQIIFPAVVLFVVTYDLPSFVGHTARIGSHCFVRLLGENFLLPPDF